MKKLILVSAALALFNPAPSVEARDVRVTGGLSTGYEYFDRQNNDSIETGTPEAGQEAAAISPADENDDADDYERFIIRPMVMLESASERDSFEIRYEPGFYYDTVTDENDVNHLASVSAQRMMSQKWRLELSDTYEIRDDADQIDTASASTTTTGTQDATTTAPATASSPDQLSTNLGRRRYTTNDLNVLSQYAYRQGSSFSLGYTNSILRNDDNVDLSYQDYDSHDALLGLDHRFSDIWRMTFTGHYIRGLYDTPALDNPDNSAAVTAVETALDQNLPAADLADDLSDDVTEYHTGLVLESSSIPHQPLSLGYSRVAYDYDSELLSDTEIHNLTLGWRWQYSPHLTLNAGAGPSYVVTDNQDDFWGYNGNLGTTYQLERGSVGFVLLKGLERQNFTGQTIDNGLVDYWDGRVNYSYNLLASTTLTLFAGYRYEDQDEPVLTDFGTAQTAASALQDDAIQIETVNTQRLTAGCSLTYAFWQWYALDLSYSYADQISDRPDDEYDEHQIMLTLSFTKEMFRK